MTVNVAVIYYSATGTVFELAKEMGVEASTANLKPQELIEAKEAFESTVLAFLSRD